MLDVQSCPTLGDPKDCSSPGSSVHGVLQARILEWVAIPFSRGSSGPRDRTLVSCTAGRFSTIWVTGKPAEDIKKYMGLKASIHDPKGVGWIIIRITYTAVDFLIKKEDSNLQMSQMFLIEKEDSNLQMSLLYPWVYCPIM